MSNIQIISYQDIHKQGVIDLIIPIQQIEFQVPITLEQQPDLQIIPQFYQINNGNFWVALADNQVIGSISLIDSGEGVGTLRKMFVHADYRGKEFGIAQQLLNILIDWAKNKGFQGIYLGTNDILKAAIRFYEKNGFTEIEKSNLPSQFPVMQVDNHFYELIL